MALTQFSATLTPVTQHQLVVFQRLDLLSDPGPFRGQSFWQRSNRLGKPIVLSPQQLRHQGELQGVDAVRLQQIRREVGTTEQHKPLNSRQPQGC